MAQFHNCINRTKLVFIFWSKLVRITSMKTHNCQTHYFCMYLFSFTKIDHTIHYYLDCHTNSRIFSILEWLNLNQVKFNLWFELATNLIDSTETRHGGDLVASVLAANTRSPVYLTFSCKSVPRHRRPWSNIN